MKHMEYFTKQTFEHSDAAFAQQVNDLGQHILDLRAASMADMRPDYLSHFALRVEFETGEKFVRVVRAEPGTRSVWGFVALSDGQNKAMGAFTKGDVFKADSWKKPAKGVRGQVSNKETWAGFTQYGPQYLR